MSATREKVMQVVRMLQEHGGKLDEIAEAYEDENGIVHALNAQGHLVLMTDRANWDALLRERSAAEKPKP